MGKTIKKNQTARNSVRSVFGGSYVVKGRKYSVQAATSDSIAADMADNGYRAGATVRWNGGSYKLTKNMYEEFSLERIA